MREPTIFERDGVEYSLMPLPTGAALALMTRAAKLLAPLAGGFKVKPGEKFSLANVQIDAGAIVEAVLRLDDKDPEQLARALLRDCSVRVEDRVSDIGKVFDEHFSGRLHVLRAVLIAAVEVNYSSFLAG